MYNQREEGLVSFIMWMTSGRCKLDMKERDPATKKHTVSSFPWKYVYSSRLVRNLLWSLCVHIWILPPPLTMSTLHQLWHIMNETRPSMFLANSSALVYYCECKQKPKMGGGGKELGNEANENLYVCVYIYWLVQCNQGEFFISLSLLVCIANYTLKGGECVPCSDNSMSQLGDLNCTCLPGYNREDDMCIGEWVSVCVCVVGGGAVSVSVSRGNKEENQMRR